eukprot:COSAG02_NODE_1300_length_13379_cov_18.739121_3_plen_71_part_00
MSGINRHPSSFVRICAAIDLQVIRALRRSAPVGVCRDGMKIATMDLRIHRAFSQTRKWANTKQDEDGSEL